VQEPWLDNHHIPANVRGFPPGNRLVMWIALPLRRWWTQDWFKPIAQIGKFGNDQYVLNQTDKVAVPDSAKTVVTDITARSDGELFLFVNDAVAMIPGGLSFFYDNNDGTATLKVESLGP